MPRSTADIETLVDEINDRNRGSTCDSKVRDGWNHLMETILLKAGVYAGFSYLTQAEVPLGHRPGIIYGNPQGEVTDNQYPDESRRIFHKYKLAKVQKHHDAVPRKG